MAASPSTSGLPLSRWLSERRLFLEDAKAAHGLLKQANGAGDHLLAVEIAEAVLAGGLCADTVPILQQIARALAVLGSSDEARATLQRIPLGRSDDGETLGLLGRVSKDLAAAAASPEERRTFLLEALHSYERGFEIALSHGNHDGAAYCGINAAAVSVWLDDPAKASELALKTVEQVGEKTDYYSLATLAEAALILGREEDAQTRYRECAELAGSEKRWADLASTRKQCRELCLKLHGRRDHLNASFPAGAIAIFSGEPLATEPLTPELEESVRQRTKDWLVKEGVRQAFGAARPGWDLVLLETAQASGVDTHLILPYAADLFLEQEVNPKGEPWISRFKQVVDKVVSTTLLNAESSGGVDFTDRMIAARGALLASHLGFPLRALAVGETLAATAAGFWRRGNLEIHTLHPSQPELDGPIDKETTPDPVPFERTLTALPDPAKSRVAALLHLHFPDHRRLKQADLESFQTAVLGTLASRLAASAHPPVARQGFGGEYLFVFEDLHPAALCALDLLVALTDSITGTDFELPSICLHAGPARRLVNPVLNFYAHEGAMIPVAGEIASRMPAGSICATETFTALAALESLRGFRFEHAGTITLDSSSERLFRLYPLQSSTTPS